MDHFTYNNGILHAEGVSISALAETVGTPFYCYSTATLERHFRVFDEAFDWNAHKVCYAVKANSNLAVLATLARLGSGADVVSEGEIRRALAAGIPAEKIVFSGVGKTRDELAYALMQGIFQFNVESMPELDTLGIVAKELGKEASIAIRVNPDVDAGTHAKISTGKKDNKFGVDLADAPALYARARALPNVKVQGVSVHIGSQLTKLQPFGEAFRRVVGFVKALRGEGHDIRTVDLGGGLGIPYGTEAPPAPKEYAATVKEALGDLECELLFEPGRMIVGNAGILVTQVIYVKQGGSRKFVIVDAAMNDLLRPAMYGAYHGIVPVVEDVKRKVALVDIVGPVCETGDTFAELREMPVPKAGELLAIRSCGAYGAVMANGYNSRLLVPEVLVKDEDYAITRPRPSYEAMLYAEKMPGWLGSTS